ncbi:MAG: isoprenylcysteine carboxylmethyltransferase family protein [Acidobacteria bacterium]|nr:isoprenylcysteine carboxylmethyltransferase family protein [Acidobacteriota bacterium]
MSPSAEHAIAWIWGAVALYWLWSSRNAKQSVRTEPPLTRLVFYWLPFGLAFHLLGSGKRFAGTLLGTRFVPDTVTFEGLGLVLAVAGAFLACWARFILGRNWSSVVQIKDDHELIEHGPYRYVRHPIYTGLLLVFLGHAVLVGELRGLLAVAIILASFWRKLRQEERWLTEHFGEPYRDYVKRTRALVPGVL